MSAYSDPAKQPSAVARVTIKTLAAMMRRSEPITMVTAYDATFARLLDDAQVDVLLVGDSLGMVVQGQESTLPVTIDEMIYHCRAVARGSRRAHLVGDMPFMSYQTDVADALRNAGRLLAEGGVQSVKLEGGVAVADTIQRLVSVGIPVMGHVGLTPQQVHAMGGYRVQGKSDSAAERVLRDARAVAEAGAYALVLEGIPDDLAERITAEVPIPTLGIGAGLACDGQVLVCYDLLGLNPNKPPKFVKAYESFYQRGVDAARRFRQEVRDGAFPGPEHSYGRSAAPVEAPPTLDTGSEPVPRALARILGANDSPGRRTGNGNLPG